MKVDVLGIKLDALSKPEIMEKISWFLEKGRQVFIVTPYSESAVAVQKDKQYLNILNSADLVLPDGIGILWAANYLHTKRNLLTSLLAIIVNPRSIREPIPEKISGSEFIWDLAGMAEARGESIFLLGGFGDTPDQVADKLRSKYPKLKIAGTYTGSPGEEGIVSRVNKCSPDYLLVAFGPEKQEKWLYNNLYRLETRLGIGLGGTFDYIAGKRASTPKILRLTGLEWFWRLITQPWRIKRIFKGVFGLVYYCFKAKRNL